MAHDCSGDVAAYVLGALERSEAQAFREHMSSCVVCRDEVQALQRIADALPMAAPQYRAPRTLRRRVLAEVRDEARKTKPRPLARFTVPRPAVAGALALALVALAVGVGLLSSGGSGGVRVIQARVSASAASAELRMSGGRAELVVRHFPPPPAGHIYEVWLKRGARPPSPTSTLFGVTSSGSAEVGLPGSLRGVSEVLVTAERAGGSLMPTRAPVIIAQLT